MKKILVCISDSLLSIRIARVLTDQGLSYEIVSTPIRKDDLMRYELLMMHSSYPLTGLYAFIDHILIHHQIPVIFISSNPSLGQINQFAKHSTFALVDEMKMDAVLPVTIQMFIKQKQRIEELEKENTVLNKKVHLQEQMTKCKRKLMDEGLSEEESHQFILKYAMDHKCSKLLACEAILHKN